MTRHRTVVVRYPVGTATLVPRTARDWDRDLAPGPHARRFLLPARR